MKRSDNDKENDAPHFPHPDSEEPLPEQYQTKDFWQQIGRDKTFREGTYKRQRIKDQISVSFPKIKRKILIAFKIQILII